MKKKILLISIIVFLIIGAITFIILKRIPLSKEKVIEKYEEAVDIAFWFESGIPNGHYISNKTRPENEREFQIVDDRFSTIIGLKKYMSKLFSDEIIDRLTNKVLEDELLIEDNGNLYFNEYACPKSIYAGEERITNIEYIDNKTIDITVSAEVLNDGFEVDKIEEHHFKIEYVDFEWKFTEFYLIGF